jgi:urea carboxylase system permease
VDIRDETPAEAATDEADLAQFGYRQELKRSLGVFSSFAVAFSYISPSTGIFTLFALGLTTIGGVFIWSWPIVAIGQLCVALGFAELSSHYPVAGSVFQWTKYLAGKTYSWFAGWIYLFAGILTVCAVCVTLPIALIPAFNNMGWNLANNFHNQKIIATITLIAITILNIFGVKLVALINNTGVLFEILGMVVFAFILALFHHHQSASIVFDTGGTSFTVGTFLIAMFMSLFVIYGFDTAGTLAEETRDPRREAPKAIIGAIIGAFIIGGIFLFAMLLAIPDLPTAMKGTGWGPAQIIDANFGNAFSTVFLLVVSAAIFVCCLSIMTSTVRLCFGMSRDDALPASKTLSWVHPKLHTPVGSCIVIGILAYIPMIQYAGAAIIAIAATGMIYLAYFIGNIALLRARLGGWPKVKAPFSLGKWGLPLNIAALVWGGAMLVNFAWPRAATNPRPNEVTGLNFHWDWLNHKPVFWTAVVVIAGVGAIYYGLVQRTKPSHSQAPEGELVAPAAP